MNGHNGGPFVYATLEGMACSICAPANMSQQEIEAIAEERVQRRGRPWQAVDKSLPPISIPPPTPNACAHDPTRLHWFLISRF